VPADMIVTVNTEAREREIISIMRRAKFVIRRLKLFAGSLILPCVPFALGSNKERLANVF
jgi:hypothetical protein